MSEMFPIHVELRWGSMPYENLWFTTDGWGWSLPDPLEHVKFTGLAWPG